PRLFVLFLLSFFLLQASLGAQTHKKHTAPPKTTATKKTTKPEHEKKSGNSSASNSKTSFQNSSIVEFRQGQIDTFQTESGQLVIFFQGLLNYLGDPTLSTRDKQTIITQSYLKAFWDPKVQIEDDLDPNRAVPLYKEVPAYLTDVSFFFSAVKFTYTVQNVSVMKSPGGQTYFKVTANRNLRGLTANGDSANWNKVRYIEINYNDSMQQLKIVSIYTTRLNEKEDMKNWWNGLNETWKRILGKDAMAADTLHLGNISMFKDSVATVFGKDIRVDSNRVYSAIVGIINQKALDISGNHDISDLTPLNKLSSLTSVNISNTNAEDITPLRNLNNLELLDCSGTLVKTLTPLKYATNIKVLKLAKTPLEDFSIISSFSSLEILEVSQTSLTTLDLVKDLSNLEDLRFSSTKISDLKPLSGLTNIELLYFNNTPVSDLSPLKSLQKLQLIFCDDSKVKDLEPLGKLPELKRIYCNNSLVDQPTASGFMGKYSDKTVIYQTAPLMKWWNGMSSEWKRILAFYSKLDETPSSEQLHRLATIDSVNISGRSTVTSIAPLSMLRQLRRLEAASSGISDITPLQDMKFLKTVNLNSTKVDNVEALDNATALETLMLDNTQLKSLKPIVGLKSLKLIFADNTGIGLAEAKQFSGLNKDAIVIFQTYENNSWWRNISEDWKQVLLKQIAIKGTPDKIQLQMMANLEKLSIIENVQITDLQAVVHLARLNELECSGTRITALDPLSGMKQLRAIRITKSPLVDLAPIATLTDLTELDISNTQVENVEPIQNLVNMEILKFSGTQLKNLKYLVRFTKLKEVEMYNTRVSNLDVFEPFTGLKSMKIFNTKISEKKAAKFKETHPGCEVVYYWHL
ncbi:MAG: leucine-rich repeat domain-containing protein, partial [Bacteroidota bacterium]